MYTTLRRLVAPYLLWLLLLLALIVRLGALFALPDIFLFEVTGQVHGSEAYDTYARNLLATGVYGRQPGTPDAAIPPLYSYVLAGVYSLVGRGGVQVGLFHTLLDLLSIALLYQIGRRLFPRGEWVGLLAGLFYAVYPYLVFQNLTLIDTPLFMLFLHAFVFAIVLLRARPALDGRTWALALFGGGVLGLATLSRPILPLFALLLPVWFLFRLNLLQTVLRLAPVALVALLLLAPWMLRNYDVYGTFVPMSLTFGTNLYQGNNPDVIPYMRAGYDVQWTAPDAQTFDPNSPQGDRERAALALAYLRDNPGDIPELLWVKLLAHWSVDIFPTRNPAAGERPRLDYQGNALETQDPAGELELGGLPPGDPVAVYSEGAFDRLARPIHRLYFGALLVLAVIGVVVSRRHWRDVSLLWFVQISMTVVYVAFHPSTRYRVPTDPLLFLFSAHAVVWLWAWWRTRRTIETTPAARQVAS